MPQLTGISTKRVPNLQSPSAGDRLADYRVLSWNFHRNNFGFISFYCFICGICLMIAPLKDNSRRCNVEGEKDILRRVSGGDSDALRPIFPKHGSRVEGLRRCGSRCYAPRIAARNGRRLPGDLRLAAGRRDLRQAVRDGHLPAARMPADPGVVSSGRRAQRPVRLVMPSGDKKTAGNLTIACCPQEVALLKLLTQT